MTVLTASIMQVYVLNSHESTLSLDQILVKFQILIKLVDYRVSLCLEQDSFIRLPAESRWYWIKKWREKCDDHLCIRGGREGRRLREAPRKVKKEEARYPQTKRYCRLLLFIMVAMTHIGLLKLKLIRIKNQVVWLH